MKLAVGWISLALAIFVTLIIQEFIPPLRFLHGARVFLVPMLFCYGALAMRFLNNNLLPSLSLLSTLTLRMKCHPSTLLTKEEHQATTPLLNQSKPHKLQHHLLLSIP